MSLLETVSSWKRVALRGAALAATVALSGCLKPMYGSLSEYGDVAAVLQTIKVEPIPDRLGHYLGDNLIFAMNGTGSQVSPHYRLFVTTRENVQTALIDTVSGAPSAATVPGTADYRLVPAAGGEPVTKGTAFVTENYDRTSQRFANIRASRDAEIRAAEQLSDQIQTRIAAALASRGPS